MNTYVLLECDKYGIESVEAVKAESIEEAIEKFEFAPFDPTDFLQDASHDVWEKFRRGDKEVTADVLARMKKRVFEFYNVQKDPEWDGEERGNYVEGDSRTGRTILEIKQYEVNVFPTANSIPTPPGLRCPECGSTENIALYESLTRWRNLSADEDGELSCNEEGEVDSTVETIKIVCRRCGHEENGKQAHHAFGAGPLSG